MMHKSIKPIIYSDIKEKNFLERKMFRPLTPSESLIHTLDVMDWMASMKKREPHPDDVLYPWIILKFQGRQQANNNIK
ncbi:MAG: hypothetical protein HYR67_14960 [Bacteroidetes bacterium]|nr:hypothetical protein [Bacteroidota bacterium]